ncbi:MAG: hypothetical protein JO308_18585 [Verrucomicrobia bacterium]|nr:hypothetical protein [Verrucomicrobiota bacterium]
MTRFPTKVLSRQTNEDGTITLFVHARGIDVENEDLPRVTTDPPIDIQELKVNTSSDGKPVTLEFRLGSPQATEAGEPITLVFEELER